MRSSSLRIKSRGTFARNLTLIRWWIAWSIAASQEIRFNDPVHLLTRLCKLNLKKYPTSRVEIRERCKQVLAPKATCWLVLIMPVGRNRLLVVNTLKTPLQCIWWGPPSAKARPAPMCSSIWCITYSPFASINNIQANTNTVRLKNINSASPWKCSRFPSVFKFSGGVLFCSCSLGFKIFFTDILTRCKPDNEQFAVFIWLSTGQ